MPSILIHTNDDGTVTAAPIDATPDMLAQGETFASLDEAMDAVSEVLGGGEQDVPGDTDDGQEGTMPPEGKQMGPDPMPTDDPMTQGYRDARRGH